MSPCIVIVKGPLYFSSRYFKYGALGTLIGHELAIALDTIGEVQPCPLHSLQYLLTF